MEGSYPDDNLRMHGMNLCILRMFEGHFLLGAAYMYNCIITLSVGRGFVVRENLEFYWRSIAKTKTKQNQKTAAVRTPNGTPQNIV